ncbi:MAG: hypothetical protein GQ554_05335 [Deltaproteobacteria bacterium]|nr:hypothetical protein [Deltaproteobacteria bacterium]MBW2553440.1 hypothetical protein [Deltaproteobacteria bacterium]NOQ86287.1 hypothetical protein [Deltaproteobacteria bacterium]
MMEQTISHDRKEETIEAKARWFQSLSLDERMEVLCDFTDIALTINPKIQDKKDAQQAQGRIQIITKT